MSKSQWGHGYWSGINKAIQASSGLVGLWFIGDGYAGQIRRDIGGGEFLIMKHSHITGKPSSTMRANKATIDKWMLYDNYTEWLDAWFPVIISDGEQRSPKDDYYFGKHNPLYHGVTWDELCKQA